MKCALILFFSLVSSVVFAQVKMSADVSLNPVGSFVATSEGTGSARMKDGQVSAENIVVSMKNLKTQMDLRDKHAKEKYLEVDKYPDAVLVKAIGKDGKGKGLFRLHGVEQKITGTYEVKGEQLIAKFTLKLSEFKITGVSYKGIGVDDEVPVTVTVPIKAESATPALPAKAPVPTAKPAVEKPKTP